MTKNWNLQISTDLNGHLDAYDRVSGNPYSSGFNLPKDSGDLLTFDDENTIQSFELKDTYKLLWAIIHIDDSASSGLHTSAIEIKDESGNVVASIPVKITVSDYALEDSNLDYGVYYHARYSNIHQVFEQGLEL